MSRQAILHVATLALIRLGLCLLLPRLGLWAISDDDYSRVAIAQLFALSPRLDPSGTSWLPFPFYCIGLPMLLLGHSLHVARLCSCLLACACSTLLYGIARRVDISPRAAFFGALLASVSPLSAILGSCTVPEWPTAVLCACSLLLLRKPSRANLALSCTLCSLACLSRYDVWPVAFFLAASTWFVHRKTSTELRFLHRLALSSCFLLGPVLWVAWNAYAHADPFHFHARVSSYRSALGYSLNTSLSLLSSYPIALLKTDVALWAALALALIRTWRTPIRFRCALIPGLGVISLVLGLMLAELRGGAPTHHPERAILTAIVVGWILVADWLFDDRPEERLLDKMRWGLVAVVTSFSVVSIFRMAPSYGVDRQAEEAVGLWLSENTSTRDMIVVVPRDYGYFAMKAAFGDPRRLVPSSSLDPREKTTSLDLSHQVNSAIVASHASLLVVQSTTAVPVAVASKRWEARGWSIYALDAPGTSDVPK